MHADEAGLFFGIHPHAAPLLQRKDEAHLRAAVGSRPYECKVHIWLFMPISYLTTSHLTAFFNPLRS